MSAHMAKQGVARTPYVPNALIAAIGIAQKSPNARSQYALCIRGVRSRKRKIQMIRYFMQDFAHMPPVRIVPEHKLFRAFLFGFILGAGLVLMWIKL